jgi:hypothetical protein
LLGLVHLIVRWLFRVILSSRIVFCPKLCGPQASRDVIINSFK